MSRTEQLRASPRRRTEVAKSDDLLTIECYIAVFETARVAWQFTYATIFDPAFIDQFARPHYVPDLLQSLVPLVAAQRMFFDVIRTERPVTNRGHHSPPGSRRNAGRLARRRAAHQAVRLKRVGDSPAPAQCSGFGNSPRRPSRSRGTSASPVAPLGIVA